MVVVQCSIFLNIHTIISPVFEVVIAILSNKNEPQIIFIAERLSEVCEMIHWLVTTLSKTFRIR